MSGAWLNYINFQEKHCSHFSDEETEAQERKTRQEMLVPHARPCTGQHRESVYKDLMAFTWCQNESQNENGGYEGKFLGILKAIRTRKSMFQVF